ncbi:cytochrome P450 716A75-like [Rutidosis leptorrhynchoides]|uniref:cytochrome P450 716A75-like n=1 Tax=Rutidosis leptorrhynchoides TaxID=125765 RepID=UPI003A9956FF
MVVISGAEANKFLFSNEEKFFTRWRPPTVQNLFPSMEIVRIEHDHKKGKKYVSFFFKSDMRKKLVATIDCIARNQLQNLCQNGKENETLEVYPLSNIYSFEIACKLFMSIDDPKDLSDLLYHFNTLNKGLLTLHVNFPGMPFYRAIKAGEKLREKIGLIIKERKDALAANLVSPNQDILTHMIAVPDDNGEFMSALEISDKIVSFIIGGYHTTSSTITYAIKYLAQMPHIYDQVKKEQMEISKSMKLEEGLGWDEVQKMKYASNVVSEVLRHRSILQVAFRETTADITYKGFTIPKGWKICWSPPATHKDPKYFEEPRNFDPSRFEGRGPSPYTFVPFGIGPRMCPGYDLSRVMSIIFLHYWFKLFNWELILPHEKDKIWELILPHEKDKIYVTPIPVQGLPVRISPINN